MKPVTKNGVLYLSEPKENGFEEAYLKLREKEGRVLSNQQVKELPILNGHALSKEWDLRVNSTPKFLNFIEGKEYVNVFEIGCGNGWFSNAISKVLPNATIYAIDVNTLELEQSSKVFEANKKLKSVYWDIFEKQTFLPKPGLIVFNASIQYFPSFKDVILRSFEVMKAYGEIHIIDSPFYSESAAKEAKLRSDAYYKSQGFADLAKFYHHHTYEDLEQFNFRLLHKPSKFSKLFLGSKNPFPWIQISKY